MGKTSLRLLSLRQLVCQAIGSGFTPLVWTFHCLKHTTLAR
jgi:hypothetical protein